MVVSTNGDGPTFQPDRDARLAALLSDFLEMKDGLLAGEHALHFGDALDGYLRDLAASTAARAGLVASPLQEAVEQEMTLALRVAVAMTARCLVAPEAVT
jgi:hypothetical protein